MHKLAGLTLIFLLICAIVFLPYKTWDLSQNKLNSITSSSKQMVQELDSPLKVDLYSTDLDLLQRYQDLLSRYKKHSALFSFSLHQKIPEANLVDHMTISYNQHSKSIAINRQTCNEKDFSTSMQQVLNNNSRWIVFLTGHQEADIADEKELGLSKFADLLKKQGAHVARLNLAQEQHIPRNTSLLIVANPQIDLLPLEKQLLHNYIVGGGKVLWLSEADSNVYSFLQEEFGLRLDKVVLLDQESIKLGSPHPAIKIITEYPTHQITMQLNSPTIFPWSGSLQQTNANKSWNTQSFLSMHDKDIALTLSKDTDPQQRVVVIADSSFILNKYLTLYANSQLISNTITWLDNNHKSFVFNPNIARDLSYKPSKFDRFIYQYGFTLILPLLLLSFGVLAERRISS